MNAKSEKKEIIQNIMHLHGFLCRTGIYYIKKIQFQSSRVSFRRTRHSFASLMAKRTRSTGRTFVILRKFDQFSENYVKTFQTLTFLTSSSVLCFVFNEKKNIEDNTFKYLRYASATSKSRNVLVCRLFFNFHSDSRKLCRMSFKSRWETQI